MPVHGHLWTEYGCRKRCNCCFTGSVPKQIKRLLVAKTTLAFLTRSRHNQRTGTGPGTGRRASHSADARETQLQNDTERLEKRDYELCQKQRVSMRGQGVRGPHTKSSAGGA